MSISINLHFIYFNIKDIYKLFWSLDCTDCTDVFLCCCFFLCFFYYFRMINILPTNGLPILLLTFSAHQPKRDICAYIVNPDKTARNELSHQDLHCLPLFFFFFFFFFFLFFRLKPHLQRWTGPKLKMKNLSLLPKRRGMKGCILNQLTQRADILHTV